MGQVFRLQHNTPGAYVDESRDFQMMCNTFDVMNGGVKFDIDSIAYQNDTRFTRESMLIYLQHKLGFFTTVSISNKDIRTILRAFPQLSKLKGSKIGIQKAVYLYLHLLESSGDIKVEITNEPPIERPYEAGYIIKITIQNQLTNIDILDAILSYIVPSGYSIEYYFKNEFDFTDDPIIEENKLKIYFVSSAVNDGLRVVDDFNSNDPINAVSLSNSTIPDRVNPEFGTPDYDRLQDGGLDVWEVTDNILAREEDKDEQS